MTGLPMAGFQIGDMCPEPVMQVHEAPVRDVSRVAIVVAWAILARR